MPRVELPSEIWSNVFRQLVPPTEDDRSAQYTLAAACLVDKVSEVLGSGGYYRH
jgi:hypothetical protein